MQTTHKGWEYGGNAPARVDGACQLILAWDVPEAANDTQQAVPVAPATLTTWAQAGSEPPQDEAGKAQAMPATLENGYDREAAAQALADVGCDPSMATGRQKHHAPEAEASDAPATAQERMAAQGRTPAGKAVDASRKGIVEPVLGQSKDVRGFRRFLLRGVEKSRGAWRLVCLTHKLLKLWRYGSAQSAASGWRAPWGRAMPRWRMAR
jgi:hypothetical protein